MGMNPGDQLGPYEILSLLGAGGMGEVYKARDTRLDRSVAIKVLPLSFTQDTERLRRFTLEAQSAGALNHPNILAIHDTGNHEGMPYLVSELLEGETLRERLDRSGKLPVSKVIDYARQAASGLAAAHARGITHRDIKPDNLFLTRDGLLKILDFGLAKQAAGAPQPGDATRKAVSEPGVVMGTAGYMSPEQVKGLPADPRSDLFSFGAVMYEMVTGTRAFPGDTAVESMHAILKSDPPDTASPALDSIIRHCLEKEPDQRFQSAKDLLFALSQTTATTVSQPRIAKRQIPIRPILALVATALAAAVITIQLTDQPRIDLSNLRVTNITAEFDAATAPVWSPDGRSFAFWVAEKGLMLRSLDNDEATLVSPGPQASINPPVFSADGKRIFYFGDAEAGRRRLRSISLANGRREPVFEHWLMGFTGMDGLAATPDNQSVLIVQEHAPSRYSLWISSPPGTPLKRHGDFELSFENLGRAHLRFSPDGKQLLFMMRSRGYNHAELWSMSWPMQQAPHQVLPAYHSSKSHPDLRGMDARQPAPTAQFAVGLYR